MIHYLDPKRPQKTLCGLPFVYGQASSDPNNVTCPKCTRKLDAILLPADDEKDPHN